MTTDHGSPSSEQPEDSAELTASLAETNRRRPRNRGGLIVILFIAATVLGPMLFFGIPREIGKWHVAAAQNQWAAGDLDGAIQTLDRAVTKYPGSELLHDQRARFYLEQKAYEKALADADRLVALKPKSAAAHYLRGEILQHLKRHDEAIASCKKVLSLNDEEWIGDRAQALNALAYFQALGKTELTDAMNNVEQAIEIQGPQPWSLDTRGYIHYLLGDLQSAKQDMDRAVPTFEKIVKNIEARTAADGEDYEAQRERQQMAYNLAVMRYHRALVYDSLGQKKQAQEERQRIRDAGFEPNDDLF